MAFAYRPLLAGATFRRRLAACLGAALGIGLIAWIGTAAPGLVTPLLVAPIAASAVLVFAVPASPLAQPWPVIGGNLVSALVGVAVARAVPDPAVAGAASVGLAILVMSLLRCLHPPGGAAALSAVIGGPGVHAAGFAFAFVPIGAAAVLLVAVGIVFHRLARTSYPHRALATPRGAMPHPGDVDRALADLGEGFDIAREDLDALLARVALHAGRRR